jgi:GntR family transcriptional regulator
MSRRPSFDTRPAGLYQRTQANLAQMLDRLPPGSYLPSEPALARQLHVSRATLREAMRSFEEEGRILRRQGVGTLVTQKPRVLEGGLEVLESIDTMAARIGLQVEVGGLQVSFERPDEHERSRMNMGHDEMLTVVTRGIHAGGRPVAFLVDRVPAHLMTPDELQGAFGGSVLDSLLRRGEPGIDYSRTEISAVSAPQEIARSLRIQRGDVLLHLEAYLFDLSGQAIDHSQSYFLPGTFCFHVVRRLDRHG